MRIWCLCCLMLGSAVLFGAVPNPDQDADGIMSETDLRALAGYLAGNDAPPAAALRADLSGDGLIGAPDLVEMQLLLAGQPVRNYVLLYRSVDATTLPPGGRVTVTMTVGHYGRDVIRGFWLTDYTPATFELTAFSVWLEGVELLDVWPESGLPGDIYDLYVARRWVLEVPPDFVAGHPLVPGETLLVVMELTATAAGSHALDACSWAGDGPTGVGPLFAVGDAALSVMVTVGE